MATGCGLAAILLWSLSIALVRSLAEQLGAVTAGAAVYCVSGVLALASLAWSRERRGLVCQLPRRYIMVCGVLFIGYMLLLYLAIGMSKNHEQVLEVGLLNYLWPPLTLLLTVALLGKKARWPLWPATLLALAGIFLVLTQSGHVSWLSLSTNLAGNPLVYAFGFAAAVAWALYSILTRKWAGAHKAGAVTLFLPATAVMLLAISFFVNEPRAWNTRSCIEVAFLGITTYVAYGFWDTAMRAGNVVVVAASSYLTPFLSTVVCCLYLAVAPSPRFWVGCGMLIAGSLLSWLSIVEPKPPSGTDP
jgi:drug/metabolite transporter (DMT)-like permease